jgi:hypothetical protein
MSDLRFLIIGAAGRPAARLRLSSSNRAGKSAPSALVAKHHDALA